MHHHLAETSHPVLRMSVAHKILGELVSTNAVIRHGNPKQLQSPGPNTSRRYGARGHAFLLPTYLVGFQTLLHVAGDFNSVCSFLGPIAAMLPSHYCRATSARYSDQRWVGIRGQPIHPYRGGGKEGGSSTAVKRLGGWLQYMAVRIQGYYLVGYK